MQARRSATAEPEAPLRPKTTKRWRPAFGTIAFEVLEYTDEGLKVTEIAKQLGKHYRDIAPLISQLRRARLVAPAKEDRIVRITERGRVYVSKATPFDQLFGRSPH